MGFLLAALSLGALWRLRRLTQVGALRAARVEALTLGLAPSRRGFSGALAGRPLRLTFTLSAPTRVEIELDLEAPTNFSARAAGLLAQRQLLALDPVFDLHVWVTGPEDWLRGRLDVSTRFALRRWIERGGRVEAGALRGARVLDKSTPLTSLLHEIEGLARGLCEGETPARLLDNLQRDPIPEVRRACLKQLTLAHPRHAETREALALALRSDDALIRLIAARAQGGPDGRAALAALALDPRLDPATRHAALRALKPAPPIPLLSTLSSRGDPLADAAIEALGDHPQRPEAQAVLLEALLRVDAHAVEPICEALTRQAISVEALELRLARRLRGPDEAITRAVVEALGARGGPTSALALARLRRGMDRAATPRLARALDQALDALLARYPEALGGLSFSTENKEDGGLSLTPLAGALSPQRSSSEHQTRLSSKPSSSSSSGSGSA
ncbi:hypothetical protein KKB55_17970 [Myxococcota bacterium]|nr:hypothetical protein [Myxococcota bacterium]MBU1899633.1 hypothetical protein [Myxococcota bacterium]